MEYEAIKKYETSPLVGEINGQLPMSEYVHGNFSNAGQIKEMYNKLLQQCFAESMKEYTKRDDGSWDIYKKEKLKMLEGEKEELINQYNIAHNNVIEATIERKKIIHKIKEKYNENEKWSKFCDIIIKALDTYPTIKNIRNNAIEPWQTRISETGNEIEDCIEKNKNIRALEKKRAEIKQKLDHKGNSNSIVAQINSLHNGSEARQLHNHISHKIKQVFAGSWSSHEDIVDIEKYFNEVVTTELCKHTLLDINTCKDILRNHTDKPGVFEYFYALYSKGSGTLHNINQYDNITTATQAVVEKLHSYNKMLKKGYHWHTQISQDEIDFIEQALLSKKEWPRYREYVSNEKLRIILRFITELDIELRPGDFEKTLESIRNADYYNYFQNTEKIFNILVYLYTIMNQEEKELMYESHNTSFGYKKIWETYIKNQTEISSTQLILFAFSDDENRNHRVRILQEYIYNTTLMPDTLEDEDYGELEEIVFAVRKTRLPLRYKKGQYATLDNRKKSREHKQVVWRAYLEKLLEQELIGRKSFPWSIRCLQKYILWEKEPLYEQFPVIKDVANKSI